MSSESNATGNQINEAGSEGVVRQTGIQTGNQTGNQSNLLTKLAEGIGKAIGIGK
jgi:hypothetical protein